MPARRAGERFQDQALSDRTKRFDDEGDASVRQRAVSALARAGISRCEPLWQPGDAPDTQRQVLRLPALERLPVAPQTLLTSAGDPEILAMGQRSRTRA